MLTYLLCMYKISRKIQNIKHQLHETLNLLNPPGTLWTFKKKKLHLLNANLGMLWLLFGTSLRFVNGSLKNTAQSSNWFLPWMKVSPCKLEAGSGSTQTLLGIRHIPHPFSHLPQATNYEKLPRSPHPPWGETQLHIPSLPHPPHLFNH